MKKIFAALIALGIIGALFAPKESGTGEQNPPAASAASKAPAAPVKAATPMPLNYETYRKTANGLLKANKTGLAVPEHFVPTNNSSGTKNMLYDFSDGSDGLSVSVETDKNGQLLEVRIVWNTEAKPDKAEKLSKAAAALLAATQPDDRVLMRDAEYQIHAAIKRHNEQRDPTNRFARGGVAYKVTVTNLPSVVLTAKAE